MDNINRDSKNYTPKDLLGYVKEIAKERMETGIYTETQARVAKFKELLKMHYDSTTPMDAYNTGMYNGMECVLCLLEEREPNYKTVEQPKDNNG